MIGLGIAIVSIVMSGVALAMLAGAARGGSTQQKAMEVGAQEMT
jgi:hypothetical protein